MIRAVLDTNTLVSAVINVPFSVSQEIYQNFINKHFELIISPSLVAEFEEVLHRDKVVKFHKRPIEQLQKIIKELSNLSYPVTGNLELKVVRDPKDDKILSAAVEGRVDYIVSRDKDLLDLKEYQGIKIITPEAFMVILRAIK